MKKILSIIFINLLIFYSFGVYGFSDINTKLKTQVSPGDYFRFINIDGRIRSYSIHIPPSYDNLVKMPIVFVLHGYPDKSQSIKTLSGMDDTADSEGFIVVYPNGETADIKALIISLTLFKTWGRVWNCWDINNVNDVNFFRFPY